MAAELRDLLVSHIKENSLEHASDKSQYQRSAAHYKVVQELASRKDKTAAVSKTVAPSAAAAR
eukprot:gene26607-33211_t